MSNTQCHAHYLRPAWPWQVGQARYPAGSLQGLTGYALGTTGAVKDGGCRPRERVKPPARRPVIVVSQAMEAVQMTKGLPHEADPARTLLPTRSWQDLRLSEPGPRELANRTSSAIILACRIAKQAFPSDWHVGPRRSWPWWGFR